MSELTSRIDGLLSSTKRSRTDMYKELNISKGAFTRWIDGSSPSAETLCSIADYLGVSMEWLVKGKNPPEQIDAMKTLPFQEQKLLEVFRILNDNDKNAVLTLANGLSSQYSNTTTKTISIG